MKKNIIKILILIILLILIFNLIFIKIKNPHSLKNFLFDKSSVSYNGWLHTQGSSLLNEKNKIIQLKGLSSHGINWYPDALTYDNLQTLKNDWKINTFRIAMYTAANNSGYIYYSESNFNKVCEIIDWCIDLDIYVIVDWHILEDNNPLDYQDKSKEFFELISKKYSNYPNIIYEICNEPNGNNVTWDKDIKPYAETIIPIIRNNSPKSLIIVGTPDWCKKIDKAADDPLDFKNIVYSCHFYSGSHGEELRNKIDYCINKNIPIFISECGTTDASGDGSLFLDDFSIWINYLNSKNISWIYWSFSEKNESSAILKSDINLNNLTASGVFIKNLLINY